MAVRVVLGLVLGLLAGPAQAWQRTAGGSAATARPSAADRAARPRKPSSGRSGRLRSGRGWDGREDQGQELRQGQEGAVREDQGHPRPGYVTLPSPPPLVVLVTPATRSTAGVGGDDHRDRVHRRDGGVVRWHGRDDVHRRLGHDDHRDHPGARARAGGRLSDHTRRDLERARAVRLRPLDPRPRPSPIWGTRRRRARRCGHPPPSVQG
jgi:hypothetical protein